MSLWRNKRGQGKSYIAVVFLILFFGFISIFTYTVWQYFVDAITTSGFNTGPVTATIASWNIAFQALDYLIVFLMFMLIIGIGITSFKLPTKNAFFIVTLIMAPFWAFISYFFNNLFIQLVSPEVFNATIGVFPRTMILCTNLHWIMIVIIIVGSITLYGKEEKGQFLT